MTSLLFYDKPVALNKSAHQDLKLKPTTNFAFARNTNSVILAGVEFTEAAKEYPIVFAQAGDNLLPVALLGLKSANNLFVDDAGVWDARYIPAFVRRYPFVLSDSKEAGQRMVCIDESYGGFDDAEGEPLFADGEATPMLSKAIEFLEEYQRQYLRTERFTQRIRDNDLLMSLNAKIDMRDGQQFSLTGLLAVDEKKLLQLPDDKALEFFKSGELAWVYCHLMSIGNLAAMIDRVGKAPAVEKPDQNEKPGKAKTQQKK